MRISCGHKPRPRDALLSRNHIAPPNRFKSRSGIPRGFPAVTSRDHAATTCATTTSLAIAPPLIL